MKFKYINLNPLLKKEEDCVCRAITLATQNEYDIVSKQLEGTSLIYGCPMLCMCCYKHLLEKYYDFIPITKYKGMEIEEFANRNTLGTYVIRVNGHLTCVINGDLYDIWDCRNEIIDTIWLEP